MHSSSFSCVSITTPQHQRACMFASASCVVCLTQGQQRRREAGRAAVCAGRHGCAHARHCRASFSSLSRGEGAGQQRGSRHGGTVTVRVVPSCSLSLKGSPYGVFWAFVEGLFVCRTERGCGVHTASGLL